MAVAVPAGTVIVVAPECATGLRLLEAAKEVGCRVVSAVLAPPEQEYYLRRCLVTAPQKPGPCDRLVWCRDYQSLLAELEGERGVVAVVPGSEFGVDTADRLAERFGVRGNPAATSAVRRDKLAMKRAIAAAGLDHAKGELFGSAEDAAAYARSSLAYPVVAKPPDSAAAQNVFFCENEAELVRAAAQVMETPDGYGKIPHKVLVEEFIPGDEYVVNLFGDEEKLAIASVWRYEWASTPACRHCYWNEFLQDPSDPAFSELCAYARRLYRAVGMRIGSAHAEIKLSPRGPVAMEIGARMMGGSYETFGEAGMRLDMPMENVKVFATGRSDVPPKPRLYERLAYATLPYVNAGTVTAVRGLDVIRGLPTFFREEIGVKIGERIAPSRYLDECKCGVWLRAATESELVRDLRIVHGAFRVETE